MENMAKFFYELGQLKKVKRSGWWCAGVKDPETVAEHSFRAAVIGRVLAELEGADENKVMTMLLFHDVPEARVNDVHKVGARYVDQTEVERKSLKEQVERLPEKIGKEMVELWEEMEEAKTKEAVVAKDADKLECAIQAKEYLEQNYKDAENWIHNVDKQLKTKSAKKFIELVKKTKSNSWWYGLKQIEGDIIHKD